MIPVVVDVTTYVYCADKTMAQVSSYLPLQWPFSGSMAVPAQSRHNPSKIQALHQYKSNIDPAQAK